MKVSTEILQILDTNSIENLFVASARFIKKKKKIKKSNQFTLTSVSNYPLYLIKGPGLQLM